MENRIEKYSKESNCSRWNCYQPEICINCTWNVKKKYNKIIETTYLYLLIDVEMLKDENDGSKKTIHIFRQIKYLCIKYI